MSEFKGTPGPWSADGSLVWCANEYAASSLYGASNNAGKAPMLDTNDGEYVLSPNPIEDARLIAAAPDLLEALVNLLAVHEGEGGTKYHAGDIARAAIAKALQS